MLTRAGLATLITAASLFGAGVILNYPELVQLGATGVAAVALSLTLAWRRPRMDAGIGLHDDLLVDGQSPRLSVTLTNRSRWRRFVTVLRFRIGDLPLDAEFDSVKARSSATFTPSLPP